MCVYVCVRDCICVWKLRVRGIEKNREEDGKKRKQCQIKQHQEKKKQGTCTMALQITPKLDIEKGLAVCVFFQKHTAKQPWSSFLFFFALSVCMTGQFSKQQYCEIHLFFF